MCVYVCRSSHHVQDHQKISHPPPPNYTTHHTTVVELTGGFGGGRGDLDGAGDIESFPLRNRGGGAGLSTTSSSKTPFLPLTTPNRSKAMWAGSSGGLRPLSRLPFCQSRPGLAAAADGLDRLLASALHGLRAYPLLRLAFLGYLLALHIWAFGLLAFHSQRLEEMHADVGGSDPALAGVGLVPGVGGDLD